MAEQNTLCTFGKWHHEAQFCEITFKFGPVIQEENLFKDISYLELWQQSRTMICAILVEGIMGINSVKLF